MGQRTSIAQRLGWRSGDRAAALDVGHSMASDTDHEHSSFEPSTSSGWMVSSFELRDGAEVTEGPDTLPPELFDEFFPSAS